MPADAPDPQPDATDLDEFESLVVDAIDRLPDEFQEVLAKVAVVVSDLGAEVHAYGQYFGDGVARERYEDRIVIYRDTLERDFGHDRDLLAAPGRADPAPRARPPPRLGRARRGRARPLN